MALLAVLLLLSLAGAGVLLAGMSREMQGVMSARSAALRLADAREAVLAWSATHPVYPGLLPFPGRAADGNYDGYSDCPGGAVAGAHLLGRLSWRGTYLGIWCALGGLNPPNTLAYRAGIGLQKHYEHDVFAGIRDDRLPWIVVSRNLVYDPGQPAAPVNLRFPRVDSTLAGFAPYPWMRVLDDQGQLLSDRVALVILDAGNAIGVQSRTAPPAAPGAQQFLDQRQLSGAVVNHADVSKPDFLDADSVATFNDRMVFVTIDEWLKVMMPLRQKRLVSEVVQAMNDYYQHWGEYPPFAADASDMHLGSPCQPGLVAGRLPLRHSAGCMGLQDVLPGGVSGDWVRRHATVMGYQRQTQTVVTLTLDGVSHVITR